MPLRGHVIPRLIGQQRGYNQKRPSTVDVTIAMQILSAVTKKEPAFQ
jgi:hypothetical protein